MTGRERTSAEAAAGPGTVVRGPTMMDVAAAAGVSQATVSLVLNDAAGARLSAATRGRVRAAAEALGYALVRRGPVTPDHGAATMIGFVADEISTDPWCAQQLDAVREAAWARGLTVIAGVTQGNPEQEAAVLAPLLRQPLVGLIYATVLTRTIMPTPTLRQAATVLLNCAASDRSLASVTPAEVTGGYVATMRLLRAGHRRIGHVAGQSWTDPARDRLTGYRRALAEFGVPFDAALVQPGNWEPSAGFAGTAALLDLAAPPTAIFCASDMTALGCYQALHERGLSAPQDVSVIGYDDREIAQFLRPALTTVLLPHAEMGARAARILIDGPRPGGRQPQVEVACPLVERGSVGPPRP